MGALKVCRGWNQGKNIRRKEHDDNEDMEMMDIHRGASIDSPSGRKNGPQVCRSGGKGIGALPASRIYLTGARVAPLGDASEIRQQPCPEPVGPDAQPVSVPDHDDLEHSSLRTGSGG